MTLPQPVVSAMAAAMGSLVVTAWVAWAIYPGALRWTGPLVCPDERPHAFVDRQEAGSREAFAFMRLTVICRGEGGDQSDAGVLRPFGIALGAVILVLVPLATWLGARGRAPAGAA